jgi:UDP-3-O-[3-hydroxymyristoyl] glucosamine N-acyltransferase
VIAGQVGIADHVTIQKGAIIGAKSAVFPNKIVRAGFWMGIPVQPIKDYKRQTALVNGLARMRQEINDLKKD